MFGVVPRALWERRVSADASHRIPLTTRCMLLERKDGCWLFDCGLGECWTPVERARHAIGGTGRGLHEALAARGLDEGGVTHLVLSHLHFDHVGGLRSPGSKPRFPGARVFVQREAWDWARSPSVRDRASFRAEDFAWLETHPGLELLEGPAQLAEGLQVLPCSGHSPGMQMLGLRWAEQWLLFASDLVPTRHHLRLAWQMAYDLQPLLGLREKAHWLGRLADEGGWLVLEHDPEVAMLRVGRVGGDFEVLETLDPAQAACFLEAGPRFEPVMANSGPVGLP